MAEQQTNGNWQERYRNALLGVFGNPQLCLDHGQGCVVVDNDGKEYLDLLAGIAVNALGYAHPAWVCLLYTSPSPRDATLSRMPSSA